jgi:glycosyltransferase involved in cell wall biosynthesis
MRIVLTTHLFLPGHTGGTEVLSLATAQELIRRGHDVVVCTGDPAGPANPDEQGFDSYEHSGVRVHRYRRGSRAPEAEYNDPAFGRWFRKFLEDQVPDLVHFFHLGNLSAAAIDACRDLDVPMVMTCTDYWLICPYCQLRLPDNSQCLGPDPDHVNCLRHAVAESQPVWVRHTFQRLPRPAVTFLSGCARRDAFTHAPFAPLVKALTQRSGFLRERMEHLDRVVVPSRLMHERLAANGVPTDKLRYQTYGIAVAPRLERVAAPSDRLRIGFIGALGEHKGAHVLVRAVRSLPDSTPLEVRIYGRADFDPAYYSRLAELAGNDPRIQFCGTFPNGQIGRILSELDALVVPSLWSENTPLVLYSAQAAGCPVLATHLGGLSEVIEHGVNGLLFPSGDARALAQAIVRIADDRNLLEQLRANSRPPKNDAQYVDELLAMYAEVLKEKGRST